MANRFICVGAVVVLALASVASSSEATTITFDGSISGVLAPDEASDPLDNCVGYCAYAATPGNEGVFTTGDYRFAALVTSGGDHGLGIVVNPAALPGPRQRDRLADRGFDVQMARTDGTPFAFLDFQAADIDPADPTVGQFVRVFGFKNGAFFQGLHFDLNASPGFQTFVLPSTWTGLSSVNFSGRLLPTDGAPRVTAIDNINVTAEVPNRLPAPAGHRPAAGREASAQDALAGGRLLGAAISGLAPWHGALSARPR